MKAISLLALFAQTISLSGALYSAKSNVVQITDEKTFKEKVTTADGVILAEFYAPWCGHCKNLAPEWDKAATLLKGVATVVAVDATQAGGLAQKYGVQGYPSIKVFGADKRSPTDYNGPRTADGIVGEALSAVRTLVKSRQQGKAKPKKEGESSKAKDRKSGGGSGSKGGGKGGSDVIELTASNFDEVISSGGPIYVEFMAPWCGHCQKLKPEWETAATELKSWGIRLAAVDATAHESLAQRFQIKGFPTIYVFKNGPYAPPEPYNGPREAEGIVAHAMELAASAPMELPQLTDGSQIAERCAGRKLCVLAFLPHILDSGKAGREAYLEALGAAAKKVRPDLFSFLWSEGGAQPGLEEAFGLTFGWPVVVAYSGEKSAFAMHVGSFEPAAIGAFLTGLTTGSTKTTRLPGADAALPAVRAVAAWDGEEPQAAQEEMSLEELFGDEL